jgi:hypothetical protein
VVHGVEKAEDAWLLPRQANSEFAFQIGAGLKIGADRNEPEDGSKRSSAIMIKLGRLNNHQEQA